MIEDVILFFQKRSGKAGAQASLARFVSHSKLAHLKPVVLTGAEGWLTSYCKAENVRHVALDFPSSRSLFSQLWGNKMFAKKVQQTLKNKNWNVKLIIANDHQEGLLAQELGKILKKPCAVILRSSWMSQQDYEKYGCENYKGVFAVGDELWSRVLSWNSDAQLFTEGLYESEFAEVKKKCENFPKKILILGTDNPEKGWPDFIKALDKLEENLDFLSLQCDFAGKRPEKNIFDLHKSRRSSFSFIGRTDQLRSLVRTYDLVIHPSRKESFGLAPMETLAAGVPVLCSRTGMIEKVLKDSNLLFEPNNPNDLTKKLNALRMNWSKLDFKISKAQQEMKNLFLMDKVAATFAEGIEKLIA
jgi:glycosyltransferase involved in cell wall biosynthesis